MDITLPDGCGNSPRMALVADFVRAWASGEDLDQWLREDATWTVHGVTGTGSAQTLTVHSIITHGRLASCDGELDDLLFSHVLRFASTAKTAKIVEIRSYHVPRD